MTDFSEFKLCWNIWNNVSTHFKAEVGNLFLVSSDKNPIITSQHFVIQVVWKNTRLQLLSLALYSDRDRHFSVNHGSFQRAHVHIGCSMLHFLVTGNVATSWLAVETRDMPYVIELASGDLTNTISRLESSWDGPLSTAATFPATISSPCESLVQTGLKRKSDNKQNKTWAGAKTGKGGCSRVASLGVSWYS